MAKKEEKKTVQIDLSKLVRTNGKPVMVIRAGVN
jgi:hypothetical protein